MQNNKELTDRNFSLLRFKNNPDTFKALLQQQRRVDVTPFDDDLQLGNPEAGVQIMVACNPYCGPCARAHEALHKLAEKENIGLTVRFAIKTEHKEDKRLQAVKYILRLLYNATIEYKRRVLHDWYHLMDLEKFREKYPLSENRNLEEVLRLHEQWADESEIKGTPTIFINGYEKPKQYRADDFKFILRSIVNDNTVTQQTLVDKNDLIPV